MAADPQISVIIPTYNRVTELRRCLSGFTRQTAPLDSFEVIVVDDGSEQSPQPVIDRFRDRFALRYHAMDHGGVSAARNRAILAARAPLLILFEDDHRPLPAMVEACLAYHRKFKAERDAMLMHFEPDPKLAKNELVQWIFHQGHIYGFPEENGVYRWHAFWGGTVTCKRSLFRFGLYDPDYPAVEDTELAHRLSKHVALRVRYRDEPLATLIRDMAFSQFYRREFRNGYHRWRWTEANPDVERLLTNVYRFPDQFILGSGTLKRMTRVLPELEKRLADKPDDEDARAQLHEIYARARYHALASGFTLARDGKDLPETYEF